jgi:hypothetical protein
MGGGAEREGKGMEVDMKGEWRGRGFGEASGW